MRVRDYLLLVKFSHTLFAMPFALTGFFLGLRDTRDELSLRLFLLVILCMVLARNAAMAFNRWADRRIDEQNERTKRRELPAQVISPAAALTFVILNAALFITTTWFINPLCFYLSPVALAVILGYSYTKRFTAWCHLVLGAGLALAPIGAYIAVTDAFAVAPVILSFAVLFWVSGFDIIYALQDEDFDKSQGLSAIPAKLGTVSALMISIFLHAVCAMLIITTGIFGGFHFLYYIGSAVFIALLTWQHLIVKPDDLSRVNAAFFTTNGLASVLFSLFAICDLLLC